MDYKSVIESRYNRQNWQLLLHDIFGNKIKFWNTPSAIPTSSQFAKQALWLGTITLSDNQTISIYEVELSDSVDIERNRRGIRDMLLTDWRNNGNAGAFMFCYRKNESVLRFSYVSEAWSFAEDGSYQKESTDAKRFTYLLGEGHRSRTAIQQFEKLRDSSLTLKDLTKAFSVDAVSDMFFDGYKKQYEDIIQYITGKRMVKVANKWEEQIKNDPCEEIMQEFAHFQNPEKAVRDYVKKLMGRLVFLQFLQKKGWLGVPAGAEWGTGDAEFIQTLFAQCQDKDHFIDNVLESLFNDLNSESEKQLPQYRTPYLNGGLFERDATDETEFPLSAKYMQSLLDFFASYNFTIDENDPDDAEVGVDPEMLGRIFENLLEDNKDKGAFYTPKEIVSYMCRESLIAYLQTGIEDETTKEAIRQFVTTHDVAILGTNDKFCQQVDEALKNVKICDPAIGSGAFPMGLLKELFQCRTALEGISQHQAAEIKKHIIQQNIYGVDIERGAVDIARLRFWLSLIVDEETPQALPNLDFKIMQGNSLLEQYKGVDLSKLLPEKVVDKEVGVQATFFDKEFGLEQKELQDLLNGYYDCTNHQKKIELRKKISDTIQQQIHNRGIRVDFGNLNLSGNNQFMLWHTWFYDVFSQGGFDIVIGNPPYVSVEKVDPYIKANIKSFKTAYQKFDLYVLFYEIGLNLLKQDGILSFITSNKFLSQGYGLLLRQEFLKHSISHIINFNYDVFSSATVRTCIIQIVNNKYEKGTIKVIDVNKEADNYKFSHQLYTEIEQSVFLTTEDNNYRINLSVDKTKCLSKIKKNCLNLSDICSVNYGLRPSSEILGLKKEAFIHDVNSTGMYKCYFEGKDMGYWLVNQYRYLDYQPEVMYNAMFPELFANPKLVGLRTLSDIGKLRFVYDSTGMYCNDSVVILSLWHLLQKVKHPTIERTITEKKIQNSTLYSYQYLQGILNSKVIKFYFNELMYDGTHFYPNHMKSLPIPVAAEDDQRVVGELVDRILTHKRSNPSADTFALESEIDQLVYQLYGLTGEEIKIIEES
jgi:hypothetical protein